MILTPEGKMARYLYGINYRPRDLRFALAEAAESRSTMALEKILLFCYHYDPQSGYVLFATNFMHAGGVLTVLLIGFFLLAHVPRRSGKSESHDARFKGGNWHKWSGFVAA